jgi:outer membrane biosynthesis protein TonB
MDWAEKKVVYISIIISFLLHLVLFILFFELNLFAFADVKKPEEPKPLEFVFEQPPPQTKAEDKGPEKFYEIVENPNATEDKPDNTDMLSTAFSRSRAPEKLPGQLHAVPGSPDENKQEEQVKKEEQSEEEVLNAPDKNLLAFNENRSFDRSALTGKRQEQTPEVETGENTRGENPNRPRGFDADLVGDFALSSYQWDWAPYWLAFKRKLNRVWFAPPAYYELGLIYGHTILRFKITRDGRMYDLEVLRQVGHASLEQSSVSAIQAVFPFLALPKDFPDEYLEVTIKMIYPNLRELSASADNQ